MKFKLKQKVVPSFLKDAKKIIEAQKLKAARMAWALAFEIQKEARLLIADNTDGTPTLRNSGGRSRVVNVSNPGEPPNLDTGRLNKSILVEPAKPSAKDNAVYVGTNLEYGKFLEFGTASMAPRPWLYPAYLSVMSRKDEILDSIKESDK